jgi:prolyl-tRNA editing enzyme YbaK/EbsC (Cys-tRNA(Pro) deacylase)
MRKTNAQRQREYRERNIIAEDATKSRLSIVISDDARLALKRLAKHSGCTQAAMLERVLLEEQRRVTAEMMGPEFVNFHDSVTA